MMPMLHGNVPAIVRVRRPMIGPEQDIARYIADFGEMIALLPAIAAVCAYLLVTGARRLALVWCAGLMVAMTATLLLKTGLGPVSGHTAISGAFYGGLAVLLWQTSPRPSWTLRGAGLALLFLVALMSWCVCSLGWHSPEDAICGLLVGGICPLALSYARRSTPLQQPAALMLLLLAIAAVMPLHGVELKYPAASGMLGTALSQL